MATSCHQLVPLLPYRHRHSPLPLPNSVLGGEGGLTGLMGAAHTASECCYQFVSTALLVFFGFLAPVFFFPLRPLLSPSMRDGLASSLGVEESHSYHVQVLGIRIVLAAPLRLPERLMPWPACGIIGVILPDASSPFFSVSLLLWPQGSRCLLANAAIGLFQSLLIGRLIAAALLRIRLIPVRVCMWQVYDHQVRPMWPSDWTNVHRWVDPRDVRPLHMTENYAIPSMRCMRVVAANYVGSLPATVKAVTNTTLVKTLLSVELRPSPLLACLLVGVLFLVDQPAKATEGAGANVSGSGEDEDRWKNIARAALLEIGERGDKDTLVSVLDYMRDHLDTAKLEVGKVLRKSFLEEFEMNLTAPQAAPPVRDLLLEHMR
ncbi:hypothetical protein BGW80DRAFT_1254378 [Lactifluus volemus]|nr:hypothetical protein BGW80DRAFT_1254378 [Lactifluus volemus]